MFEDLFDSDFFGTDTDLGEDWETAEVEEDTSGGWVESTTDILDSVFPYFSTIWGTSTPVADTGGSPAPIPTDEPVDYTWIYIIAGIVIIGVAGFLWIRNNNK